MNQKILFVDDDPLILNGFRRNLGKLFEVKTADGPVDGLKSIRMAGPFAVVVSDYVMPEMNGTEFLVEVHKYAPETVRMMLTGHADVHVAMNAVNTGQIFRFLTKPCPTELMIQSLNAGVRQYQLVKAEQELLEQTLRGSVEVLTDILTLASPAAFGKASRVEKIMDSLADKLRIQDAWEFSVAGMLSMIGCLTLPTDIVDKIYCGEELSEEENQMFSTHTAIGHDLLVNIPRLRNVAEMIAYQNKNYDGTGTPEDEIREREIPRGARALRIAMDYDSHVTSGLSSQEALDKMAENNGSYDSDILDALAPAVLQYEQQSVMFDELRNGMILADHIPTKTGSTIIAKGQKVSQSSIARLRNIHKTTGIQEPIKVLVPLKKSNDEGEDKDQ